MTIKIQVIPGLTPGDISLKYYGSEISPATQKAIVNGWAPKDSWENLAGRLIRGWLGYAGYGPSIVLNAWGGDERDASGWNDGIVLTGGKKGHRGPVPSPRVRLEPIKAEIVTISEQTTLIDHAIWDNQHGIDVRHYESAMSQSVSESVGSSWEKSQTLGISAEVGVEVGGVGAKTSVSYETTWGESHSVEHSQELGTSDSISGDLKAGELSLAALTAKRGTLVIDVTYKFDALDGYLLAQTRGKSHGSYRGQVVTVDLPGHNNFNTEWIGVPFRDAVRVWYGGTSIINKQQLTVGFFADADLTTYPIADKTQKAIDAAAEIQAEAVTIFPVV